MLREALCIACGCLALAACKREPTFDERYADAQKDIRATASEIDREIARSEAASNPDSGDGSEKETAGTEPTGTD